VRRGLWPLLALAAGLGGWLLAGCHEGTTDAGEPADPGARFFDVTWHNEAWGHYELSGWCVDGQGRLFRFDRGGSRWSGDADTIPAAEMLEKYARGRELVGQVTSAELAAMTALLPAAAAGPVSPQISTGCADFGTISYQVYTYLPQWHAYARVLLHQRGDVARRNAAPAAAAIHAWLVVLTGTDDAACEP
jgi:hypothetical protein